MQINIEHRHGNSMGNERLGEVSKNTFGSKMSIIEYNNSSRITVQFEDGYIVPTTYIQFKSGLVTNPYDKTLLGIGFMGIGAFKSTDDNKTTLPYAKWNGMIERCYSEKNKKIRPTYIGCSVCNEWHNFQTFAKWYNENYYEVEDEVMCLDKDILIKGNKIYSPETCLFAPQYINTLFVKKDANRGDCPIGVSFDKSRKKYKAYYRDYYGDHKFLGRFSSKENAFQEYKVNKEKLIRRIAEEYKLQIPSRLYDGLYAYKIEITD